jgi:diadenylate cyclase
VPPVFDSLRSRDALEIVIEFAVIWAFVFVIFRFLRGTRGAGVIKGFFLLTIGLALLVRVLGDATDGFERLRFLFDRVFNLLAILLIVVFQPEIRAAFGRIGRAKLFRRPAPAADGLAAEIAEAAAFLSKNRFGALIVIERRIGIGDLLTGGVELDAKPSASLIQSIFWPNSPLHDLALVVRGGRIAAAGVQLPLADGAELPSLFGARHRAALGVSEESDALVVVVSEETGQVRLAEGGTLSASVPLAALEQALESRLSRSASATPAATAAAAAAADEGAGDGAQRGTRGEP